MNKCKCGRNPSMDRTDGGIGWKCDEGEPQLSGTRKHRGLYVSKDGFAVNADVNGSLNIGRKVIPEFLGLLNRKRNAHRRFESCRSHFLIYILIFFV